MYGQQCSSSMEKTGHVVDVACHVIDILLIAKSRKTIPESPPKPSTETGNAAESHLHTAGKMAPHSIKVALNAEMRGQRSSLNMDDSGKKLIGSHCESHSPLTLPHISDSVERSIGAI